MKKIETLKIKRARRLAPRKRKVDAQDLLSELEEAGLVRRLDESEPGYLFKHTLTQESAYQSLLNRTRRDIHLNVASVYEDLYSNRLDEYSAPRPPLC
jgi:predicted ATPase